jgi:hypothetical protein
MWGIFGGGFGGWSRSKKITLRWRYSGSDRY